jgi:tetratricopeptide (TPR) repeat protein
MTTPRTDLGAPATILPAALLLILTVTATAGASGLTTASDLMGRGEYARALPILRAEAEKSPDDPRIAYFLGLALNRTIEGKEAESVLKSALMTIPDDPALNLELGILYFTKNIHDEAADYFEQTIQLAPDTPYARQADGYLRRIRDAGRGRPWTLNLAAGAQYDSNVMLNGSNQPLPAGYAHESDWSAVINAGGSYTFLSTDTFAATAGYSFYQNLHDTLTDFDVAQHQVELAGTYTAGEVKLKGSYAYEYLFLGGDKYDYANVVGLSLSRSGNGNSQTGLDLRHRETSYRSSPRFVDNADRNGGTSSLALSHLRPLGSWGNIWAGYGLDAERTKRAYWDFLGNRCSLGLQVSLPLGLSGVVTGEVNDKRYSAQDPGFGTRRTDLQYTVGGALTATVAERFSLTLGEVFIRNDSNIGQYDYNRALTSLMLSVRL